MENEKEKKEEKRKKRKKVQFRKNVKMLMEAGMLCNINGDTFNSLTKNIWIGDSGASCHITNDNASLFDVTDIYKSIQGSSCSMPVIKKISFVKLMVLNGSTLYSL